MKRETTPIGNSRSARSVTVVAAMLTLALSAFALAACSGQQTASSSAAASSSGSAVAEQAADSSAAATIDTASWKTLGDGLALATTTPNASWNDTYYVCDFEIGDSFIYAVAKMAPGVQEKIAELDFNDKEYDKKLVEILGELELVRAEDVTAYRLDQAALDALVGKTGQELLDDGFVFGSYFFYGGEETGATLDKDYFAYDVTFDASTAEDSIEDEGESIKNAKVTAIEFQGTASSTLDPERVE